MLSLLTCLEVINCGNEITFKWREKKEFITHTCSSELTVACGGVWMAKRVKIKCQLKLFYVHALIFIVGCGHKKVEGDDVKNARWWKENEKFHFNSDFLLFRNVWCPQKNILKQTNKIITKEIPKWKAGSARERDDGDVYCVLLLGYGIGKRACII